MPQLPTWLARFSPHRGVREIPELGPDHQSNVPGVYVVGDLAGAPVLKLAFNQGYETGTRIATDLRGAPAIQGIDCDVLIAGAGPAGIGAALALATHGISCRILEKERPFNALHNFTPAKPIFTEPASLPAHGGWPMADAPKEELLRLWEEVLAQHNLPITAPARVEAIQRESDVLAVLASNPTGETQTWRARRVIVATGRRGAARTLNIPGEQSAQVAHALDSPTRYTGQNVIVIGGGDAAVEAALALADAQAHVTLVHRGPEFNRAKAPNRARLATAAAQGHLRIEPNTVPVAFDDKKLAAQFARAGATFTLPYDAIFVLIGAGVPKAFLQKLGIRMAGALTLARAAWMATFAAATYLFYVLKHKQDLFPFGHDDPLAGVPALISADLGFRAVDAGFWGTVIYSILVAAYGMRAYRKYPAPAQRRRYVSLVAFQLVFLFGIPELLAPLVIDRPWKLYALTVPWPLSVWSLVDAPAWAGGSLATAVGWLAAGALAAFVAIPLYVRKHGLRFCSYLCGCGGLAETLGDQWRHLAPRGLTAFRAEWAGRIVFFMAVPVTLLILNDAWAFLAADALRDAKTFAQHWYGLMVDFWLASIVGVALYPVLGNRVWCRFFCPLRAWMEWLARRFARVTIVANDRCIGCGECTRYCQMGIDVERYAQRQALLDNSTSSCIQCGICIEVCPMKVLNFDIRRSNIPIPSKLIQIGPATHGALHARGISVAAEKNSAQP